MIEKIISDVMKIRPDNRPSFLMAKFSIVSDTLETFPARYIIMKHFTVSLIYYLLLIKIYTYLAPL